MRVRPSARTGLASFWRRCPWGRLLLLGAMVMSACGTGGPPAPNVLLITIDTLRADHVGAWGYPLPTTPNLDALAADSVVFERASAHASWTLPSLATLMTSLHTSTHGCWTFQDALGQSFTTLAEILAEHGYATAAVVNHVFLGRRYGLHQGFRFFDESLVRRRGHSRRQITSDKVTGRAVRWIREHGNAETPWFLWVHYFDPHDIYRVHPGISERFGTKMPVQRYDGEIAFTDLHIGELLRVVDELATPERTIVWVVGDHGEEFGDHGGWFHGRTLYQEQLHVPLMVRAPHGTPGRFTAPVGLIDVLPTTLDLLGLPIPGDVQGESRVDAMRGAASASTPILAEVGLFRRSGARVSVQQGEWKLIRSQRSGDTRLFNLAEDPRELRDVAEAFPGRVRELETLMDAKVAAAREQARTYEATPRLQLTEPERRRLESLGYLELRRRAPGR